MRLVTGGSFSQIEKRGATDTGCLPATSNDEIGKTGPVSSGCGENRLLLRCRRLLGIVKVLVLRPVKPIFPCNAILSMQG